MEVKIGGGVVEQSSTHLFNLHGAAKRREKREHKWRCQVARLDNSPHHHEAPLDVNRLGRDAARVAHARHEVQDCRRVKGAYVQRECSLQQPQKIVKTSKSKRLWKHFEQKRGKRLFKERDLCAVVGEKSHCIQLHWHVLGGFVASNHTENERAIRV